MAVEALAGSEQGMAERVKGVKGEVTAQAFPIAAVAIAAAAWCARGAPASVPTSVSNDIYVGRASG